MPRGTYKFEVSGDGDLENSAVNVNLLRKLLLERKMIKGDDLGPGDPGDFDHGAWHVACHVAAGCGVHRCPDGGLAWLQIAHDARTDRYFASVTVPDGPGTRTVPMEWAESRLLLNGTQLLGFVEGASKGRTLARGANDPPDLFNLWRRQDFDQPPGTDEDGGTVWETLVRAARHSRDARDRHLDADGVHLARGDIGRSLHPHRRARASRVRPPGATARNGPCRTGRPQVGGVDRNADGNSAQLRTHV